MLSAPKPNISLELLLCVSNLIYLSVDEELIPIVQENRLYNRDITKIIIDNFNIASITFTNHDLWRFDLRTNVVVIDVNNEFPIVEYMLGMLGKMELHRSVKYIFVVQNISGELFAMIRKFYFNDPFFVETSTAKIFTYFPYKNKDIRSYDHNLVDVGTCSELNVKHTLRNVSLSAKTTMKKWKVIAARMRPECSKFDTELVEMAFKYLNITPTYVHVAFTVMVYSEVYTDHEFDLIYCNQQMKAAYYVEFTKPYLYDTMSIYVKTSEAVSSAVSVLKVFNSIVWILLIIFIFFLSLMITISHFSSSQLGGRLLDNFITIIALMLEQSKKISMMNWSSTILIYLTIFFVFIMSAIYKGNLYNVLTGKEFVMTRVTNEEILKDYYICLAHDTPYEIRVVLNENRMIKLINSEDCAKQTVEQGIASLIMGRAAKMIRSKFMTPEGKYILQKIDPSFYTIRISLLFPKGHPLVEPTNKVLVRLFEHGIVDRMSSKYDEKQEVNIKLTRKKLNIRHLSAPLVVWVIGIVIASTSFILENVFKRIRLDVIIDETRFSEPIHIELFK